MADDTQTEDQKNGFQAGADDTSHAAPSDEGEKGSNQSGAEAQIAELVAKNETLAKDLDAEKNAHLRSLADFQNFRRRKEEELKSASLTSNKEMITALLPVLDNFERALGAAEKNQSYDALIGGVKLTLRQIQDYLKKQGVTPIEAVGKEFDPALHDAVMRVEDSDQPENTVVEELQRGYILHDKVLRPAMVKVARSE